MWTRRKSVRFLLVASVALISAVALCVVVFHRDGSGSVGELTNAAAEGDIESVQSLLRRGSSINERPESDFGYTPLMMAIHQHETNMIRYLVESGADVNLPNRRGQTPLMEAIGCGDEWVETVKYLIALGADLRARDDSGATALAIARAAPPRPKVLEVVRAALEQEEMNRTNR